MRRRRGSCAWFTSRKRPAGETRSGHKKTPRPLARGHEKARRDGRAVLSGWQKRFSACYNAAAQILAFSPWLPSEWRALTGGMMALANNGLEFSENDK